jgi:hypothetical protein
MLLIVAKHTIKPRESLRRVSEQRGNKNATNFFFSLQLPRIKKILSACFIARSRDSQLIREKKMHKQIIFLSFSCRLIDLSRREISRFFFCCVSYWDWICKDHFNEVSIGSQLFSY